MSESIVPYLNDAAFDSEITRAMGEAYDRVRKSLHDKGQPGVVQDIIARRIIEIARSGERDPSLLCERVLLTFGIDRVD